MVTVPDARTSAPPAGGRGRARDASSIEEDRFMRYEMGRLTERLEGLKESTHNANRLQLAAILVGLTLAAFGAWGFNSQIAATNARIDRLDDKLSSHLERIDQRLQQLSERMTRLEPTQAPAP